MQQLDLGLGPAGDEGEGDVALLQHVGGGVNLRAAEPDVQERGVQAFRAGDPDRLAQRADGSDHLEAGRPDDALEHRRDPGVVLDNENPGRGITALHATSFHPAASRAGTGRGAFLSSSTPDDRKPIHTSCGPIGAG
jgi:hypothetical protein